MTSFGFTWNKGAPNPGKAFARKRKTKETNEQSSTISNKESAPISEIKKPLSNKKFQKDPPSKQLLENVQKKDVLLKNKTISPSISEDNSYETKLVKRKQKKDKLVAKLQKESGEDVEINSQKNLKHFEKPHSLFTEKTYKKLHIQTDMKGKSVVENVFSNGKKFSDLEMIHKYIVNNLEKIGYSTLTNVQEKSIPVILTGKNVLIRSQTGSGKTLAYAVPILNALQGINPHLKRSDGAQAIIVVPTRELALQTHELFGKINTFQWIVTGHLCGGENRKTEKDRLRKGVHIVIGTPGRLLDHILHTTAFKIHNVRCLVLDEADRLLDMGFKKDIVKLVEELDKAKQHSEYDPMEMLRKNNHISFDKNNDTNNKPGNDTQFALNSNSGSELHPKSSKSKKQNKFTKSDSEIKVDESNNNLSPLSDPTSKNRQTLLLSATLTKAISELADFTMSEHTYIDALDESASINLKHMIMPNTVKQEFMITFVKHRLIALSAILVEKCKQNSKVFVFMATSQMVDYHYELFNKALIRMPINRGKLMSGNVVLLDEGGDDDSDEEEVVLDLELFKLHGNSDHAMRKDVFKRFREAKKGVLICTDVAARGIDVPAADCIIQYTGPQSDDDYLHRVGRTGRAGKSGSALIFLTHEEQEYVTRLQDHRVFLQEKKVDDVLHYLCDLMEEPDQNRAVGALQKRFESVLANDKELHQLACFAYSSWSRFYNTYSSQLRPIFNFKNVNLGHYVTSFGLKETPTAISKIVRGHFTKKEPVRLNRKLTLHEEDEQKKPPQPKRKIKSISLTTSEFDSGLEPLKKKRKKSK